MLTVEEALDVILASARPVGVERISLDRCLRRVPASFQLTSAVDVPPFANSSMDGFALRAADAPGSLQLVGEVAAGAGALPSVEPGTTVRIMTGAPMPPGANAVAPLEIVHEAGGRVTVPAVEPGAHVRAAGHDTLVGEQVDLAQGPLTPAGIAVVASLGLGELEVRRRPRVAILSTGDELRAPGEPRGPGQIHDANSFSLAAAVAEAGGEAVVLPRTADDPAAIEAVLRESLRDADALVASGGVSVGRHDHVRDVLQRLGTLDLWRVAMQPGKPLAFGRVDGRPVLGLPGNPVSALVTFELFGRPLIRAMLGLSGGGRPQLAACAAERMPKDRERRAYLRVVLSAEGEGYVARSAGGQQSSQLRPLAAANALLIVPEGEEAAEAGGTYQALVLGALA